jgi:predicted enzyme related to lactoylglutathione lyase
MTPAFANPVVHLELHTGNLPRACAFYRALFGWEVERVDLGTGSYHALELGDGVEGGVVEHDAERCLWLPYVEVADVREATGRARRLGASVLLEPREGPAGWRSVVAPPAGAEVALWEPKAPQPGGPAGGGR